MARTPPREVPTRGSGGVLTCPGTLALARCATRATRRIPARELPLDGAQSKSAGHPPPDSRVIVVTLRTGVKARCAGRATGHRGSATVNVHANGLLTPDLRVTCFGGYLSEAGLWRAMNQREAPARVGPGSSRSSGGIVRERVGHRHVAAVQAVVGTRGEQRGRNSRPPISGRAIGRRGGRRGRR